MKIWSLSSAGSKGKRVKKLRVFVGGGICNYFRLEFWLWSENWKWVRLHVIKDWLLPDGRCKLGACRISAGPTPRPTYNFATGASSVGGLTPRGFIPRLRTAPRILRARWVSASLQGLRYLDLDLWVGNIDIGAWRNITTSLMGCCYSEADFISHKTSKHWENTNLSKRKVWKYKEIDARRRYKSHLFRGAAAWSK